MIMSGLDQVSSASLILPWTPTGTDSENCFHNEETANIISFII